MDNSTIRDEAAAFPPMTPVDVIRVDWPSSRNGGDTKISDIHIADVNDELAKDVHAKEMQKRSMSDPIRVYYEPLKTPNQI
jgi:hypothetical protein